MRIPRQIADDVTAHARELAPVESCGYFGGRGDLIEKFYRMTNVDNSPEHFSFDPKEQFAAVKDARAAGLDLIAVYHSHPASPARFSDEDRRLAQDPNIVYMILSLQDGAEDLRAFRLSDGEIVPENLEFVEP